VAKHMIGCALWSLAMPDTVQSIRKVAELGFEAVQLTFLPPSDLEPPGLKRIAAALKETGLKVPGGMVGFPGEDWASIASIRKTGGLIDAATFPERLEICKRFAAGHAQLGIRHITTHVGFVPEPGSPNYAAVVDRIGQAAEAFRAAGLTMGMETGQERAEVLLSVIKDLGGDDVSINFDPANFVLYASDDPVRAARLLGSRTSMAHMKDAIASDKPGEVWGVEPALTKGEVNLKAVLKALEAGGFKGPLIVEREGGEDRPGDLAAARRWLLDLMAGEA